MILVTGGAGYIGSHTVVVLLEAGFDIVILDNLCNSAVSVIDQIEKITQKRPVFIQGDIRDADCLTKIFQTYPIDAVIHFAGLKAVGESMQQPLQYFDNNITGSIVLLQAMDKAGVTKLVFSSSATVYGEKDAYELVESMPTGMPTNNYGYTKLVVEQMLEKYVQSKPSAVVASLRYFNPIGAHPSGLIGEDPKGTPNNLMPYIAQVATGKLPVLNVYGDDYPTPDGTAIRDYVHVMDLAAGHLKALLYIMQSTGYFVWNLGTGKGHSVLEMIQKFESNTQQKIPYQIAARRPGDIAACWANALKAQHELGWVAQFKTQHMIKDLWRWQLTNINKQES